MRETAMIATLETDPHHPAALQDERDRPSGGTHTMIDGEEKGRTNNFDLQHTKWCKKPDEITETLGHGCSSESTQQALSNEYQLDRV